MSVGVVGRKCGMMQVFTPEGVAVPVTVVWVEPNQISQIKTLAKEGYNALQVAAGKYTKPTHVTEPLAGHFVKANIPTRHDLHEFRIHESVLASFAVGDQITVNLFKEGQLVDVIGTSKGKGFAGSVKRHNFRTQDATHGNSRSHRVLGSIGQNQSPGKVFKGKKMAGHMGNVQRTVQNQRVIRIDTERNLLLIKGAIPGAPGSTVVVMPAVKAKEEN